ncbi:hypothetical protein [Streptomyces sp. AC495_CC817]|uniref:hypothetical protein n=1 Tax=Streptomyces sp. AC495_CC817 TaxID=2823900 RepID=UPI001C27D5D1|nr:hypothetical protein [Streptomyces sp. AC495_CC817]
MSERPKEGVYLDAALGVIGEQVEERIDELIRRRRVRSRVAIAALGVMTLASGTVAAAAVTTALQASTQARDTAPLAPTSQVRCIEGADTETQPFFTVTYRIPDDARIDETALCLGARQQLLTDADHLALSTPQQLASAAEALIVDVADTADVVVDEASYGVLPPNPASDAARIGLCVDGSTTVVLFGAPAGAVAGSICPGGRG